MDTVSFEKPRGSRPRALVCYICGRSYGTNSLNIHLKACAKVWEERESKKPKRERKPLPKAPEQLTKPRSGGRISSRALEEQNNAAFEAYNSTALSACPHCNRTFLEEPLKRHMKVCRPESIIGKKLKGGSGLAGGNLGKGFNPAEAKKGRSSNSSRPRTTSPRDTGIKPWHKPIGGSVVNRADGPKSSPKIFIATPGDRKPNTHPGTSAPIVRSRLDPSLRTKRSAVHDIDSALDNFLGPDHNRDPTPSMDHSTMETISTRNYEHVDNYAPVNGERAIRQESVPGREDRTRTTDLCFDRESEDPWECHRDDKTGRTFYVHARTGKRRWTKPASRNSLSQAQDVAADPIKTSRAGSIWTPPKEELGSPNAPSPVDGNFRSSPSSNIRSARETALEGRVSVLESELMEAKEEIARLKDVMLRFQSAFSMTSM